MTDAQKALNTTNMDQARQAANDIEVFGDPGMWICICKASSKKQGWMKSTKVMNLPFGCIMQTTTEFRNVSGEVTVAEDAIVRIPNTWWTDAGWQAGRPS